MKFVNKNYYEILDVDASASEEEIKRAYRLVRGTFKPDSIAIYSLYTPEESDAIRHKIEEAFQILSSPERRPAYDRYLKHVTHLPLQVSRPEELWDHLHQLREQDEAQELLEDVTHLLADAQLELEEVVEEQVVLEAGMGDARGIERVVLAPGDAALDHDAVPDRSLPRGALRGSQVGPSSGQTSHPPSASQLSRALPQGRHRSAASAPPRQDLAPPQRAVPRPPPDPEEGQWARVPAAPAAPPLPSNPQRRPSASGDAVRERQGYGESGATLARGETNSDSHRTDSHRTDSHRTDAYRGESSRAGERAGEGRTAGHPQGVAAGNSTAPRPDRRDHRAASSQDRSDASTEARGEVRQDSRGETRGDSTSGSRAEPRANTSETTGTPLPSAGVGGWTRSYARSQKPTRPLPDRPISAATLAEAELELGLSGAYLKAIREYKGITLDDVTERTKIQIGYLKAVEEERFEMLPAAVYVDGFVRQLARLLKLDVQKVANGYMARYTPPGPRDPDVF